MIAQRLSLTNRAAAMELPYILRLCFFLMNRFPLFLCIFTQNVEIFPRPPEPPPVLYVQTSKDPFKGLYSKKFEKMFDIFLDKFERMLYFMVETSVRVYWCP